MHRRNLHLCKADEIQWKSDPHKHPQTNSTLRAMDPGLERASAIAASREDCANEPIRLCLKPSHTRLVLLKTAWLIKAAQ